jgi:hypothetical protein
MSTNSFLFVRFISQLVIYTQDDSIFLIRYSESWVPVPVLTHIDDVSSCQRVIYTHDENTFGVVDKIFIEIPDPVPVLSKILLHGRIRFVSLLSYPTPSEV